MSSEFIGIDGSIKRSNFLQTLGRLDLYNPFGVLTEDIINAAVKNATSFGAPTGLFVNLSVFKDLMGGIK